jgi:competence protein ComGF
MLKNKTSTTLKASTLLEVITAMVMIMVIFTVATSMFIRVTGAGSTIEKINAQLILNHKAIEVKLSQNFKDDESKEGELNVKQHIKPHGSSTSLLLLHLEAFNNDNKKLADLKELVLIEK